jgi:hypothetical protein
LVISEIFRTVVLHYSRVDFLLALALGGHARSAKPQPSWLSGVAKKFLILTHRPLILAGLALVLTHRPLILAGLALVLTHRPLILAGLALVLTHRPLILADYWGTDFFYWSNPVSILAAAIAVIPGALWALQ